MNLLSVLYWVLLIIAIIATFAPADIWPRAYLPNLIWVVLFILIGLRVFRTPIQ